MKPSGPGLLFVGRFFITASISMLVMGLLRFSPHSDDCLFTLLIVSFAVQKLLNLIRSHLFTFVFISVTLGGGS